MLNLDLNEMNDFERIDEIDDHQTCTMQVKHPMNGDRKETFCQDFYMNARGVSLDQWAIFTLES